MNTLYVHGSVVWVTIALFVYWGFFTYSAQTLSAFLWIMTAVVVRRTVQFGLAGAERLCGAGAQNSGESGDQAHGPIVEGNFVGALMRLIALTAFAGPKATAEWRDGIIAAVALSCWSTHVEQQATGWAHWPNWRFRAVAVLSGFVALFSAILQWSFFATISRPRDERSETVYYTLIVWATTVSVRLVQSLTFEMLHILYATRNAGGDESEFDPMEEVGLTIRSIGAAMAFFSAVKYCPEHATALMQLTVIHRFYAVVDAVLRLHHFNDVLRAVPEIKATGHCVICLESIRACDRARKLHCGHIFHTRCLRRWLMRADHCPMCRRPAHQQYDEPISLFSFGVERQDVPETWTHPSQDVAVQTTFNRRSVERPPPFHGSLRPLTRPLGTVRASTVVYADAISNSSISSSSSSNNNPGSTCNRRLDRRLMMPPLQPQRPAVVTRPAPTVSPIETDDTSEFADRPIVQPARRNPRRKRNQVIMEEEDANVTIAATVTTTVETGDTESDSAPYKRLRLEESGTEGETE
ncbi:zinc finger protein [Trypanosoma melophagium]|uniref:zinc finger protein n=1 Tax=Trypanosoma melophagium TaxID=715481 RepID=UPI00351A1304|nr:zinc finger protein [Trypanosoma melophagium]